MDRREWWFGGLKNNIHMHANVLTSHFSCFMLFDESGYESDLNYTVLLTIDHSATRLFIRSRKS